MLQVKTIPTDLQKRIVIIFLAIILVVMKLISTVDIPPYPSTDFFIGVTSAIFGAIIIMDRRVRIDLVLTVFCIIAIESVFINKPSDMLGACMHMAYFMLMTAILSPLIQNDNLTLWRRWLWHSLIIGLRIIVIINAIMYLFWEPAKPYSGYGGCLGAPMLAAVVCGIVAIEAAYQALCKHKIHSYLYAGLFIIADLLLLLSGSRAAILATILGLLPIILHYRRYKRLWIGFAGTLVIICGITFLSKQRLTHTIQYKTELAISHDSYTYSRDRLWSARIAEFKSSPLIGIGFGTCHRQIDIAEPGSSWLNILSTTGLLGFALIVWFNIRLFIKSWRKLKKGYIDNLLFISLLIALWIHGCFEGWALFAGSLTFFIYWLLTSMIQSQSIVQNENTTDSSRI